MKIGVDISQLAHSGGVAEYTRNLANFLSRQTQFEVRFFYGSLRKPLTEKLHNVKSFPIPPSLFELLFYQLNIPMDFFLGKVDIFHSSDWVQPRVAACKVTTYHDLTPIKYPEWSLPNIVRMHRERLKRVESDIDQVIAVSNSTKQDLIECSEIPPEKIVVIYEGVDPRFFPQPPEQVLKFKKDYHLPEKFILAIGGVGERRNLQRVKEVASNLNIPLVISKVSLPELPNQHMPLLYSSAEMLVYPSFYEGFGLPLLEAFACGVPVITSRIGALLEIGRDAALFVDPFNTASIAEAIKALLSDHQLRIELVKKGLEWVKKFSWEESFKKTLDIYQTLGKKLT